MKTRQLPLYFFKGRNLPNVYDCLEIKWAIEHSGYFNILWWKITRREAK